MTSSSSLFFRKGLLAVLLLFAVLHLHDALPNGPTACSDCSTCLASSISHVLISGNFNAGAFQSCLTITEISFGSAVTSIPNFAFNGASNVAFLNFPDTIYTFFAIGNYAFGGTKLTSVVLPDGVTGFGTAFFGITTLTSITIPGTVTSIAQSAFAGTGLINVTFTGIFASGLAIGDFAFAGISSLTGTIALPNGVTFGNNGVLTSSGSGSLTVDMSACTSMTSIAESTFQQSGITAVVFPNTTLTTISNKAFSGTKLVSVVLPRGLTSFGTAFENVNTLVSISLPDSLTSIVANAFSRDNNLNTLLFPGTNYAFTIGATAFSSTKLTSVVLPDGVTNFATAFQALSTLTSLTIPSSVTTIEAYALMGSGVTNLTFTGDFSANGLIIKNDAFNSIALAGPLVLPDGLTSVGASSFQGLTQLTSLTLPDSLTTIGSFAFYGSGPTSGAGRCLIWDSSVSRTVAGNAFNNFVDCSPSSQSTVVPTAEPSTTPSSIPSIAPSEIPTDLPTEVPTDLPSVLPSVAPSATPSVVPSIEPSREPSIHPTVSPSQKPSVRPSRMPTVFSGVVVTAGSMKFRAETDYAIIKACCRDAGCLRGGREHRV